jgi:tetratricopeptide (TPR) repeat protein
MPGYRQVFEQSMKRGQGFARQHTWDKAVVEFQRALAEFPDDQNALVATTTALINLKRWADVLPVLEHAHEIRPDDIPTLERLAGVQEQLNKAADAAQSCASIGELYDQQGGADQAIQQWTRASQLDPENIVFHQKLAAAYQKQNMPKQAVTELLVLVNLYRKNGDLDQAAIQCHAALALDPRNTDGIKLMSEIRIERGTGTLPPLPEPVPAAPSALAPALPKPAPTLDTLEAVAPDEGGSGSPVDMATQRALSDLAEFIFEETLDIQHRPDARGAAAHLTKDEVNTLISQAIDVQRRGENQEAIAIYQRVLDAFDLPAARFNLGLLYELELRFDEAIEQFQQSVRDPEYALGSHFALGECYRARNHKVEALQHFVQVLKLLDLATVRREQINELTALYENLAETYLAGDRAQAEQFTNSLVEFLTSKGWDTKVGEARERLDTLSSEGAPIISLAEMLTVPNVEAVLQSLALMQEYTRRGKTYTALEEAYAAIGYAADYLPMHRRIGDILWEGGYQEAAIAKYQTIADTYQIRGDYHQATAIYQRILNLMPMDVQTRSKLIDMLLGHQEIDQALEQYMALAETYDRLADLDKTREKYQEAIKYVPRSSDSRRWAQRILHKIGDLDMQRIDWRRAIQDYEQIKAIISDDERARLTLVELRFKTNDTVRAIKELDDLLVSYSMSGKAAKIIPVLEEQVRNHPNEMGLRMRLGRAYLGAGLTTQAIEQLDALGDLQLQAGLVREATATIKGIIALNPPNVDQYKQILSQISSA